MAVSGGSFPDSFPESFPSGPADLDTPILREHVRYVTRWLIGEAVGDRLTAHRSDALAEEIALILSSGLTPVLRREIELQAEKTIAGLQNGPVSFDHEHRLLVDGWSVPDILKLLDAVGRLVEAGVAEQISALHATHRRMLHAAHDSWRAKHDPPDIRPE